jgi:predicted nucleotidyltransferase
MKEIIKQNLEEIERTENVKILYATESGSRMWGFASPDSDYDVRFIYVRPVEFYLKLEKTSDVIEWKLDDVLDINGWDLQKMLRLLHTSNPTLFEWASSPLIYKTTPEWEKIRGVVNDYFISKTSMHHYLSMAKRHISVYLETPDVSLKKYFYGIRPVLACKWIAEKGTPPPVLFSELMDAELDDEFKPLINDLLRRKSDTNESGKILRIDELNAYIKSEIEKTESLINSLPKDQKSGFEELDRIFTDIILNNR